MKRVGYGDTEAEEAGPWPVVRAGPGVGGCSVMAVRGKGSERAVCKGGRRKQRLTGIGLGSASGR